MTDTGQHTDAVRALSIQVDSLERLDRIALATEAILLELRRRPLVETNPIARAIELLKEQADEGKVNVRRLAEIVGVAASTLHRNAAFKAELLKVKAGVQLLRQRAAVLREAHFNEFDRE